MSEINYSEWPVMDTNDFEFLEIDATRWEDNTYTAMFNFYSKIGEDEEKNSGMTICTQLHGESLQEIYMKCMILFQVGIFDGVNISNSGNLWNDEGDVIAEIDWEKESTDIDEDDGAEILDRMFNRDVESDDDDEEIDDVKITHRGTKTLH